MKFRLERVSVEYAGIPAVRNLSIDYDGTDVLILMGATGAGKTTLLRLLYADVLPSQGDVMINGVSTSTMSLKVRQQMRRKMGIVQQDGRLMSDYTVFENVLATYALSGYSRRHAEEACLSLLADLNISYVRQKYPRELSGGERHLVALARALAVNPEVVIADEPTGTLDPATTLEVARIFQRVVDQGIGVVVSTHNPAFAAAFPTARTITLAEGALQ
ncbi:MAG: cell division ATP-binding protein FtsE [Candidatus Kapaibacteriota bacterium]|jgi:cell division transport system ATP-binding protein